jgi:hypothetical protein
MLYRIQDSLDLKRNSWFPLFDCFCLATKDYRSCGISYSLPRFSNSHQAIANGCEKGRTAIMNKRTLALSLFLTFALALLAGCGGSSFNPPSPEPPTSAPLSSSNLNLIFVASEDLAYQASGDMNPSTANLTSRGLQRTLKMATFLQQKVLGWQNVTEIYALEPMTHLQTANNYPDMVALETIQQFAMLNQVTMSSDQSGGSPYAGQSYPINASYAAGLLPVGVASPAPPCPNCQGLDFGDQDGDNEALVTGILNANANVPGFYVFSAPWETVSALMANINQSEGYNLKLPASYISPNYIYAISITPSGSASFVTYDSGINPAGNYPTLPAGGIVGSACLPVQTNTTFHVTVTGGTGGAVIPKGINTNETLYFIRHADAHPLPYWDDNNYVGAGQWRALDLPNALRGKISPNQVYSIDPAQYSGGSLLYSSDGSVSPSGDNNWSTVAPALTPEPYAIANELPYNLVTSFQLTDSNVDQETSTFFFFINGGQFSNQSVLVAWSFQFIQPTIVKLLKSYNATSQQISQISAWPSTDYDTIWTVTLDGVGNLTVNNAMCEGIDSATLPATPPRF